MKTRVEFRSDIFPPYDGEEEEINPGLWGKRLSEYLQENLPHHGVNVTAIGAADWGWMFELENDEFPLWIGCGHQNGDNDEFLCFIEPSKPFVRKLFKKIHTTAKVSRVSEVLKKVLETNPNIRKIKWASESTS